MKRSFILDIFISLFVLIFVYAAFAKIIDFSGHVKAMHNQPLAEWLINILVYAIPISEIIIVALLMTERTKLLGIYLFTTSMMAFTVYVGLIIGNHYGRIPCSCGGLMRQLNWNTHLYINLFLTSLGIFSIYLAKKKRDYNSLFIKPASAS